LDRIHNYEDSEKTTALCETVVPRVASSPGLLTSVRPCDLGFEDAWIAKCHAASKKQEQIVVSTENLNPDVVAMKSAKDRI
jgi:hypothetical protein